MDSLANDILLSMKLTLQIIEFLMVKLNVFPHILIR